MVCPPKGHPERPLRLAASSMLTLGVLGGLLGLPLAIAGAFVVWSAMQPTRNDPGALGLLGVAITGGLSGLVGILLLLLPGVSFFVAGIFLKRHRKWAAVLGLVTAGLLTLALLLVRAGSLSAALEAGGMFLLLPLSGLAAIAVLGRLIYWLVGSLRAIQLYRHGAVVGSEPVMSGRAEE